MRSLKSAFAVLSTISLILGLTACDDPEPEITALDDESALFETEGGAEDQWGLETETGEGEGPIGDTCKTVDTCKSLKAKCSKAGGLFIQVWFEDGSTNGSCN